MRTLDFSSSKVELLTVDELKSTYHENQVDGTPVGGIYHFALIERLFEMCEQHGMRPEVQEIFAANNRDSRRPGVTVLPQLEAEYGEGSLESHLLRRIYANIAIRRDETDELVTNLAVAYHQRGIQLGIGPMVKVCHNQTILSATDVVSTYSCFGNGRLSIEERSIEHLFEKVELWLNSYDEDQKCRMDTISAMRVESFDYTDFLMTIGMLVQMRVTVDEGLVKGSVTYPLNGAQINLVTADMYRHLYSGETDEVINYWDAYQYMNRHLKAGQCDIPQILPQSSALFMALDKQMRERV